MDEENTDERSGLEKRFAQVFRTVEVMAEEEIEGEDIASRYQRLKEKITLKDPKIDYTKEVTDNLFRAGFSRMDTPEERKQYLNKFIGNEGWDIDKYGAYIVNPAGLKRFGIESDKPIPIDSPLSITRSDIADIAGAAPGMLGGTGGAIAASGYGLPVGLLATGTGAMLGKAIDEIVEQQQGYNLQSFPEVAAGVGEEGLWAIGGEGIARSLKPFGRYIMGPHTTQPRAPRGGFGKLPPVESTIDPTRKRLAEEAMEMGGMPSVAQATDKKIAGRIHNMINNIFGDPLADINRKAIRRRAIELQREAGGEISRRIPHVTATTAGKGLRRKVQQSISIAKESVEAAERNITSQVNKSLTAMRKVIGSGDPNVNEKAVGIIKASKDHFFTQAKSAYGAIDDLVDGQPLVGAQRMKNMAQQILEESPKAGEGRVFVSPEVQSELSKIMQMDDFMTFKQAQTMRTLLREAAYDPNMIKGVGKRRLQMLKSSVDDAISEAGDYIPTHASPIVDVDGLPLQMEIDIDPQVAKLATKMLKETDEFYKKNIAQYDDIFIERITRAQGKPGAISTEEFVEKLSGIRSVERINKVKKLVGEKTWSKIQREYVDNILLPYTDEGWNVNARQAFNKMNQTKNIKAILGDKTNNVKELLREIAARNGKVNVENLSKESNIVVGLKETLKRQKALDKATGNNFFKKIDAGQINDEQIVDYLYRPKNTNLINQTKKFLGENSPEWERIRQRSMIKMLDNMVDNISDPTKEVINGKKLMKAMEDFGYSASVSDNPVTEMFGKDLARKLNQLAKVTSLLTQKPQGMSGGLVAATIALHPIKNLGRLAQMKVMSKFLTSPTGINYMINGFNAPKTRAGADAFTKMSMQILMHKKEVERVPEEQRGRAMP